jgi:uncharacterized RDD family membrane protein YckC
MNGSGMVSPSFPVRIPPMFQESVSLETPEHVGVDFEVAGPMSRYAAALYDLIILALVFAVLALLGAVLALAGFALGNGGSDVVFGGAALAAAVAAFLYFPLFETFRNGQTPGKKALGLRVMRRDMAPLDFRAVFFRHLLRVVDGLPGLPFPLVGMISMTVSERALRLGDLVAGTWVVRDPDAPTLLDRKKKPVPAAAAGRRAAASAAAADAVPAVEGEGRLTEEEHALAREFLGRRAELDLQQRRTAAVTVAGPMLRRLGETRLDAEKFLEEEVRKGPASKRLL